jgi:hypothetical protein
VKRHLFNALAVISLALCTLSCGCWISSYLVTDFYKVGFGSGRGFEFDAGRGLFVLGTWSKSDRDVIGVAHQMTSPNWLFSEIYRAEHVWPIGPLTIVNETRYDLHHFWAIFLPSWLATVIFIPLPVAWLWRRQLRRRYQRRGSKNRCIHCGYDLRATPNRCPECGQVPT